MTSVMAADLPDLETVFGNLEASVKAVRDACPAWPDASQGYSPLQRHAIEDAAFFARDFADAVYTDK